MKNLFERQFVPLAIAVLAISSITVVCLFLLELFSAPQARYGALTLNFKDYSLINVDHQNTSELNTKEQPHRFRVFNIYDSNNRLTDNLCFERKFLFSGGRLIDWNEYKAIPISLPDNERFLNQRLVIRDRFFPKPSPGNWPEFTISASTGETPVISQLSVSEVKTVATYLVYLYASSDLLYAAYGTDGTLIQIAHRTQLNGGFYHPQRFPESDNPYERYQLPDRLDIDLESPPLNSLLQSGLAHVKSAPLSKSKLVGCFLISRAADLRAVCVRSFDSNGTAIEEKVYENRQRPWDAELAASYWKSSLEPGRQTE